MSPIDESLKFKSIRPVMSCSKAIATISFAEIIHGRDSSVRVTDDHLVYAVDLAMIGTGKGRDYAGQVTNLIWKWIVIELLGSDNLSTQIWG